MSECTLIKVTTAYCVLAHDLQRMEGGTRDWWARLGCSLCTCSRMVEGVSVCAESGRRQCMLLGLVQTEQRAKLRQRSWIVESLIVVWVNVLAVCR